MKRNFLSLFVVVLLQQASAQNGSAELMAGHRCLHYQHNLTHVFSPQSRFGWQHITTLIKRYQPAERKSGHNDELMNQACLTCRVSRLFAIRSGLFYSNAGG